MCNMIEKVMDAARKYTVVDYGFFKSLMISFGILLGVYFAQPILNIRKEIKEVTGMSKSDRVELVIESNINSYSNARGHNTDFIMGNHY